MKKVNLFKKQFKSHVESQNKNTAEKIEKERPISSFRAIFDFKDLEGHDSKVIDDLMLDVQPEGDVSEDQAQKDSRKVKHLTAEIKCINRQQVILIGERINRVRTLLKDYNERVFEEWLKLTFGSPRTPYNILAYYRLYQQLPPSLRPKIKEIPLKAAYVLACREGELEAKKLIVQGYNGEKAQEILSRIQEALPKRETDKRIKKSENVILLDTLEKNLLALLKRKQVLESEDRCRLQKILEIMQQILF